MKGPIKVIASFNNTGGQIEKSGKGLRYRKGAYRFPCLETGNGMRLLESQHVII